MCCTVSIKVSLHNCLKFIKTVMMAVPLDLHVDHWDFFDLLGVSIDVWILESMVNTTVDTGVAIYRGERKGVLFEMVRLIVLEVDGLGSDLPEKLTQEC